MSEEQIAYFRTREQQSRANAEKATDAGVRRIHLDMAEEYKRRAESTATVRPVIEPAIHALSGAAHA